MRLSAFDTIPFGKSGTPESFEGCIPYRLGFGVNPQNPVEPDLTEPIQFLSLLRELDIRLVNITAGSPYYESAHAATGAVSAFGWISAAGRSAGRRRPADGRDARA